MRIADNAFHLTTYWRIYDKYVYNHYNLYKCIKIIIESKILNSLFFTAKYDYAPSLINQSVLLYTIYYNRFIFFFKYPRSK